jgi:hypothetical protein
MPSLVGSLRFHFAGLAVAVRALIAEHERKATEPYEIESRALAVLHLNLEIARSLERVETYFTRIRPLLRQAEAVLRAHESTNTRETNTQRT